MVTLNKLVKKLLETACKANNLNAISLRYFNPIGAHDSTKNR